VEGRVLLFEGRDASLRRLFFVEERFLIETGMGSGRKGRLEFGATWAEDSASRDGGKRRAQ